MFKAEHGFGRFQLQGLSNMHLGTPMQKDVRASFIGHTGDFNEKQIYYSADDVVVL